MSKMGELKLLANSSDQSFQTFHKVCLNARRSRMTATDFLQINAASVLQSLQTSCLGIAGPGGWGKNDDFGCGRLLNWFLHRAVPSARLFSLYRLPATGLLPTAVFLPRCSQLTPAAVCQGQEPPPVFPEKSLPALEPGSACPAGFCIA